MNQQKLIKISIISFIISIVFFVFNYFFFHYFTEDGFTTVFHEEPQKPFVSERIGELAVLFLFFAIISLIIALVCYKKENKAD